MYLLNSMMNRFIKIGQLTIIDVDGKFHVYGQGGDHAPSAKIRLKNRTLYRSLFLNPELRAGEAYMDGTLSVEGCGIRDLLEVFAHNRSRLRTHPLQKTLRYTLKRVRKFHQRNTTSNARKNVKHHYDLSNDFYKLFLDEDMNYSCAYYASPDLNLEAAQLAKKRHITAKLNLQSGMRVLDIGCGWGGMALYLAEHAGVEVVGVTLSNEQRELAVQRAKDRGLEGKVDFLLADYRDVNETFDRIVSIGMFEHVGVSHYLEFFSKISDLLSEDGLALVHSIGRKGMPGTTGAWIRKYIFPGGYSPSLSETFSEIEKVGLWVTDVEILRLHYAETLLAWEKRFQARRDVISNMMDERFCRMWEFYLIVSEFTFRYGGHMNFQIQLAKTVKSLPLTRDYMIEAEQQLH